MAAFAFLGRDHGQRERSQDHGRHGKRRLSGGDGRILRGALPPAEDRFPGKALIAFSGSDGGLELTRALAGVFQARGLTTLALAYVGEEGLPQGFSGIPIEYGETAAKRLHGMGYGKVGLWASPRGRSWL